MNKTTNGDVAGGYLIAFAETVALSEASQEALFEIIGNKELDIIMPDRREFTVDGMIIHSSANERYKQLNGEA